MQAVLKRGISADAAAVRFAGAAVFLALTVLSGFIRFPVPMSPVPVTLQTFFVLLSGACLGGVTGGASQIGYLALGVLGVPVFSSMGSGFLYLAGPTGGYMAGFVFAAFLTGHARRHAVSSGIALLALFLAADAVILFSGALWLKILTGCSIGRSIQIGVMPFIPGDLLKAAGAAAAYRVIRSGNYF
ncbi:MAG TPA: biotin transporter BioY [Candidatus Omnitrophota bacterium]|nr:biotin transporter BioY [Candidatus Omnitrophota bacterium]HNQ50472.1 biotin transporter BioY [Candidatus Omnitrophota bacterium]HQO37748.1 biotin transporter BioY [Candidatus Omnitrophota bacterium]HQQ05739.1 biotin transporter BioY [Candidatus Omnitrophota bacterium]